MKKNSDDLRAVLREWRDVPADDPALGGRVLREIRGEARGRSRRVMPLRLALAGIAAGVLCGVSVAEWRAQRVDARDMPQRYIAWIDPLPGSPTLRP